MNKLFYIFGISIIILSLFAFTSYSVPTVQVLKECNHYDFDVHNDQSNTTWLNLSNTSEEVIIRCMA